MMREPIYAGRVQKQAPVAPADTLWFRRRLAGLGMSQNELAGRLGMDKGSMSLTLRGWREARLEEVVALAAVLQVGVGEVMGHLGAYRRREGVGRRAQKRSPRG